jgi:hypothetical protein
MSKAEYQIRDLLFCMRLLRLGLKDRTPEATMLWLLRKALGKQLFDQFNRYLDRQGYETGKDHIVYASILPVLRQRNHQSSDITHASTESRR